MIENIYTPSTEVLESSPGGWFDCEVIKAGPAEDGTIFILLKEVNGAFDHWFSAVPSMKREMLAVALAAMARGKLVSAAVSSTDIYSVINRLYVWK